MPTTTRIHNFSAGPAVVPQPGEQSRISLEQIGRPIRRDLVSDLVRLRHPSILLHRLRPVSPVARTPGRVDGSRQFPPVGG